jgi:hypothetical protein
VPLLRGEVLCRRQCTFGNGDPSIEAKRSVAATFPGIIHQCPNFLSPFRPGLNPLGKPFDLFALNISDFLNMQICVSVMLEVAFVFVATQEIFLRSKSHRTAGQRHSVKRLG